MYFCSILGGAQYSTEVHTKETSTQWKTESRVWEKSWTHQGEETETRVIFITAVGSLYTVMIWYNDSSLLFL